MSAEKRQQATVPPGFVLPTSPGFQPPAAAITPRRAEWTASKEDVERWLKELDEQCNAAGFQSAYKVGYRDALVSVMHKMNTDRKRGKLK